MTPAHAAGLQRDNGPCRHASWSHCWPRSPAALASRRKRFARWASGRILPRRRHRSIGSSLRAAERGQATMLCYPSHSMAVVAPLRSRPSRRNRYKDCARTPRRSFRRLLRSSCASDLPRDARRPCGRLRAAFQTPNGGGYDASTFRPLRSRLRSVRPLAAQGIPISTALRPRCLRALSSLRRLRPRVRRDRWRHPRRVGSTPAIHRPAPAPVPGCPA